MSQPAIRILVVDDESAIRRALRPPLLELGFQVAEASRGEEALQLLRALFGSPFGRVPPVNHGAAGQRARDEERHCAHGRSSQTPHGASHFRRGGAQRPATVRADSVSRNRSEEF